MTISYRAFRRFFPSCFTLIGVFGCFHPIETPSHKNAVAVEKGRDDGHAELSDAAHRDHHNHSHEFGDPAEASLSSANAADRFGWIKDDYEKARAEAERKHLPLVVDIWAKWCRPCVEMHRRVLGDPRLEKHLSRFVWLMLDTDEARNRFSFHLFKTDKWPTYLIVNPLDEQEMVRLEGAHSLTRFMTFLESGAQAFDNASQSDDENETFFENLRAAKRSEFQGNFDIAAEHYDAAWDLTGDPRRRVRLLDAEVTALFVGASFERCEIAAALALDFPAIDETVLNIIETGAACRIHRPSEDRGGFAEEAVAYLEIHSAETFPLKIRRLQLLRTLYLEVNRPASAQKTATRQKALLDKAAAEATSQRAALQWDRDRAEVYLFLGQPEKLLEVFEERARDLSGAFEPHRNLAWLAYKIGNLDTALKSARIAVSLAPDPERGEVLSLLADIVHSQGDRKTEGEVRRFLVEYYESLPPVLTPFNALEKAKGALSRFEASNFQ